MKKKIFRGLRGFVFLLEWCFLGYCFGQFYTYSFRFKVLERSVKSTYFQSTLSNSLNLENDSAVVWLFGNSLVCDFKYDSIHTFKLGKVCCRGATLPILTEMLRYSFENKKTSFNSKKCEVFIEVGINDILFGKDLQKIGQQYQELLAYIKGLNPESRITLFLVEPEEIQFGFFVNSIFTYHRINKFNAFLVHEVKDKWGVRVKSMQEATIGFLNNKKYTRDGIHFNEEGNSIWYKTIENLIFEEGFLSTDQ